MPQGRHIVPTRRQTFPRVELWQGVAASVIGRNSPMLNLLKGHQVLGQGENSVRPSKPASPMRRDRGISPHGAGDLSGHRLVAVATTELDSRAERVADGEAKQGPFGAVVSGRARDAGGLRSGVYLGYGLASKQLWSGCNPRFLRLRLDGAGTGGANLGDRRIGALSRLN